MSRRCAIFDLDRTVTCRGTWARFLLHANRDRPGVLPAALRLLWRAMLWKLRLATRDDMKEAGLATLTWATRRRLEALGESFAAREVATGLRPGALRQIEAHRRDGDTLILLTAAPEITALPIARRLGFDHVICTPIEWSEAGHPTGKVALPNCYGAVKAARLDALARDLGGIDLVAAYSDHVSDIGLLRTARCGVAVNPSRALRRIAEAEGFEIARMRISANPGQP
ncbi:MAG: HAD-IB family hydrolase, partial [Thermohalobaculum sp.]|nr:HAD-IB family hydrolase [Thermohalobaculum sp.]